MFFFQRNWSLLFLISRSSFLCYPGQCRYKSLVFRLNFYAFFVGVDFFSLNVLVAMWFTKREGKQILLRVSGRFEAVLSSYQREFELTRVKLQSTCKGNRLSFELARGSSYWCQLSVSVFKTYFHDWHPKISGNCCLDAWVIGKRSCVPRLHEKQIGSATGVTRLFRW